MSVLPFPRIFIPFQTTAEFTNSSELFSGGQVTAHQSQEIISKLLKTRAMAVGASGPLLSGTLHFLERSSAASQLTSKTRRCEMHLHERGERKK